jgi:two-component system sensor histidine kinase HydH
MPARKNRIKAVVIGLMIGGILCLHYLTLPHMRYHHAVYRMLFYLPLVLGSLWFGLKGALFVSVSVSILYFPHLMVQWQGFSLENFHKLLEGVLYIVIGVIVGSLVEKERKKHRALLRADSLAAVGKAVSEVAHDMKTPLMAIGGFANQISGKLGQDDPNRKKLDVVIQETARLESMVEKMLDFGRPLELQPTKTSLNELVQESIEVAQPMAREGGVELKADLEPSLPALFVDIPRGKQVFLNLITNAVQASSAGEHVTVRTRHAENGVAAEVIDRGCGIKEQDRQSVFHPFFSTKKGGAGLGLSIVKKIVEAHGGQVSFHTSRQEGVTFVVRLPSGAPERLSSQM